MRIFISGGQGQLANRLTQASAQAGFECLAPPRADLDICDADAVRLALRDFAPTVVINAAAYTAVDAAEADADACFAVNRDGASAVAAACAALDIALIHISTDYVFSGASTAGLASEHQPYTTAELPDPIGVYAQSKRAGELAVLEQLPSASIVRTGWLYDFSGRNFFTSMCRLAESRTVLPVVADQVGCPTYAGVFAEDLIQWAALLLSAPSNAAGIHHYGHGGQASWFTFASRILARERPAVEVRPISTAEFPTAALRPAWSKLDERPFFAALDRSAISWEAALSRCFSDFEMAAVRATASRWTRPPFDEATSAEVRALLASENNDPLIEQFHTDLKFGTGGMRGRMGVGTNRVNRYTIAMATQGLAAYLKAAGAAEHEMHVAIAFDCRNNSPEFAQVAAEVLAANGITAHVFESLRPTPELSFAVRQLGCAAGIVITASHNPKEYNGYKVYWSDGAQVVSPHDDGIIAQVRAVADIDQVNFAPGSPLILAIPASLDLTYRQLLVDARLNPALIAEGSDLPIVFSALHGAGSVSVPPALASCGFRAVAEVAEQADPDGNFSTVTSPNPEEPAALKMAIDQAMLSGAQIVLATDPDSDRVGVAAPDSTGTFKLFNGNQIGALLVHYVLEQRDAQGQLQPGDFVARTVVTTRLIDAIAAEFKVDVAVTLTGFKWIAAAITEREKAGSGRYLVGGEESYGYLVGDAVRDKDAAASAAMICEMADVEFRQGRTLWDRLDDLHARYGHYKEALVSVVKEGRHGASEITALMDGFRSDPPSTLGNSPVVKVIDLLDASSGLPLSNVMQFETAAGALVTARPSGTEPKIKYYFSVRSAGGADLADGDIGASLDAQIDALRNELERR